MWAYTFHQMRTALILTVLLIAITAPAQWEIQAAPTAADLRGIHALGNGIAWASGSEGTVLRTTDSGAHWQRCATPPGAEHLDFRGIQAFDASTAVVMSSGKGPLSRLYKTADGCQTWKLIFTDPDPEGFWDAFRVEIHGNPPQDWGAVLLGDPVHGRFRLWQEHQGVVDALPSPPTARKGEAAFAASNSGIFVFDLDYGYWIATGGVTGSRVIRKVLHGDVELSWGTFPSSPVPVGTHTASSGIFSIAFANIPIEFGNLVGSSGVAVGGDYLKPDDPTNSAAFTADKGKHWLPAQTPPHGFRSAVAYAAASKTWITVGPNGTDISTDDGRNWRALRPDPALGEAADADEHWNALSLPFVVGPHGRIGRLRVDALHAPAR